MVSTPSGDLALVEGEYELINRVEEENATEAAASVSAALPTGGFVILDTALDADLLAEATPAMPSAPCRMPARPPIWTSPIVSPWC